MKKMQKNRKIVAAILTVVLLFSSMGGPVFAEETDGQSQAEMLTEERDVESTEETVDVNETESEATSQPENTGEQVGNGEVPTEKSELEETETQETQPQNPGIEPETEPQVQDEELETELQKPETDEAVPETEAPEEGEKPQMQAPQITEPSASEPTSSEAEVLDLEKSGNVSIGSVQFLETVTKKENATTQLTGNVTFDLAVTLTGEAETVWVGYRLELPKKSPSGGTYSFISSSHAWLQSLDDNGPAKVKEEGENWVLEGKVLAQNKEGHIAPGVFAPTITVHVSNLVNNETAKLKGECWLIKEEETPRNSAVATMTAQGISEYYATNSISTPPRISGYFDKTTGNFSIYEPEQSEGYVYGRVYIVRARVKNSSSTERLDPTKPISYDLDYKLLKTENGIEKEVTDPNRQPVLMAVKQDNNTVKESQLEGTPVNEFTLNGLIKDHSGDEGNYDGDYVLSKESSKNSIHVSATLSTDKQYIQQRNASIYALFFIPVDEVDGENNQNISYKFQVETTKLEGTSYSGSSITPNLEHGENKRAAIVPPKASEENIPSQGLFSRDTNFWTTVIRKGKSLTTDINLTNTSPNNIADYKIHSINMLVKFEGGLTLQRIENRTGANYTGNCTLLYGVKPDGTGWKDEVELNHTQDYELVYYDSYDTAAEKGTIVAVLVEFREGIWMTGHALAFRDEFLATGNSGSSQVIVQDIKVWRNTKDKIESWKGTNGERVEQKVEPNDFMKPYDNPQNKTEPIEQRVYRRDIWPENEKLPQAREGSTWGDTVFISAGLVQGIPRKDKDYPSKNLNGIVAEDYYGSSNAIFDVSLGQRIVDRVYCFQVSGVGNQELTFKAELDRSNTNTVIKQTGSVYLSTDENPVTYVPNADPTKPGTFEGGTVINPDCFTIPGDGKYRIYFSCFIGNEKDISKDASAGVYDNACNLMPFGNTLRYATIENAYCSYTTTVTRTAAISVDTSSVSETTTDEAKYTLKLDSYNSSIDNTFILDILPYNDDDVGSKFHGSYSLSENQIQVSYQSMEGAAKTKMRLFYTEDEGIRSAEDGKRIKANIFRGIEAKTVGNRFEAGNVTWQEAAANPDHTTFTFPAGTTPKAVVFAGTIHLNERMIATISLTLQEHKVGDTYHNISSTLLGNLKDPVPSEVAEVTVIGRDVSGKVWQDSNKNGIFDQEDTTLKDIRVRLYQADDTEIKENTDKKPYGEMVTGADGSYCFEKVPESSSGYYVKFEGGSKISLEDYQTIEPYKNGAQSPYEKTDDSDVIFQQDLTNEVSTEVFTLLSDSELSAGQRIQKADGINAGFEELLTIQAEKEWKGKAGTEQQVTVQLQHRKGSDFQWENIAQSDLNDDNSWKSSFEKQLVFYKNENDGVERYQYRVVELNASDEVAEDGTDIVLNGNTYQVKYDETAENSWKIINSRLKNLTIEKEVNGDFGDRTKKFAIDISAQDSDGKPLDGIFACEESGAVKEITFKGGKAQTALAHGEKITIKELPYGTRIEVTETKADGYTVKYVINKGVEQEVEQDAASLELTEHSVVKVIDTKTYIPDTGIFHNPTGTGILIFIGILGIVFVGISVFRKRKGLR